MALFRDIEIWAIVSTLFLTCWVHSLKIAEGDPETRKFLDQLLANYSKDELPPKAQGPFEVDVNIQILSIRNVNARKEEFTVDMMVLQFWNDSRLSWRNSPSYANNKSPISFAALKERIWLPDMFFHDRRNYLRQSVPKESIILIIEPNGEIFYSQMLTHTFSCNMDFGAFPFSNDVCKINIKCYAYPLDKLRFRWKPDKPSSIVDLPGGWHDYHRPKTITTYDCSQGSTTSCLGADFNLQRQVTSYLAAFYIPSALIIVMSWLGFWLDAGTAVVARVTLGGLALIGCIGLMCCTTLIGGGNDSIPSVGYVRAIDVWSVASLVFVIAALVEMVFASWRVARNSSSVSSPDEVEKESGPSSSFKSKTFRLRQRVKSSSSDEICRFLFPIAFVLFNIFYWAIIWIRFAGKQTLE